MIFCKKKGNYAMGGAGYGHTAEGAYNSLRHMVENYNKPLRLEDVEFFQVTQEHALRGAYEPVTKTVTVKEVVLKS